MTTKRKAKGFVPQKKSSSLQLAGKSISAKNATSLVSAKDAIAAGLASLDDILESAGLLGEEEVSASLDWENSGLIGCGSWEDYMRRSFWHSKLESVLSVFSYYFEGALYYESEGETDEYFGSPEELKLSLMTFLQELQDSYESTLSASAMIQASSTEGAELITLTVPKLTLLQSSRSPNRLPIEGMLFQCDVVSEGIPAKGPGKRLMIPRSVALAAVDQIQSLPLDADPSLRKHCNDSIVGTMLSARIKDDNGFWISGNLFPWSQPEIVASIRASKHEMGFSINAYTRGHDEEIDSEVVHVIDELTLVGANILYADSATFSGTKLVTAQSISVEPQKENRTIAQSINLDPTVLISASKPSEDKVMEETLKALTEQIKLQGASLAQMSDTQVLLGKGVELLLQDRASREETAAAAKVEEDKKATETALANRIMSMLSMQPTGASRSNQPSRIVPSVLQSSVVQTPIETQIALLQAEMNGLRASGSMASDVMTKRIELTDQISALKSQMTAV